MTSEREPGGDKVVPLDTARCLYDQIETPRRYSESTVRRLRNRIISGQVICEVVGCGSTCVVQDIGAVVINTGQANSLLKDCIRQSTE